MDKTQASKIQEQSHVYDGRGGRHFPGQPREVLGFLTWGCHQIPDLRVLNPICIPQVQGAEERAVR